MEVKEPRKPGGSDGAELGETARQMRAAQPYIAAVWKLVGGAVVGVLGGYWLDKWLETGPWLMVVLSLAGICVGFYGFLREMSRLGRRK
ncbi:ATP synthase protein I [Myxococcus hansupus]|uniref:ATP synthase protein I n=1 Tax=Pseudomyxococcus hansupus TaxID=1297742 RepID=A0A0H4X7X7_9BACT|nr:AtpZ/AtpI family protein [Myxococcus hansupus]AKQ69680.1 ATP synthase protein I [Myxococcus hansupus]